MNKEQVYDEQINPLMAQIIEIAKAHHIDMMASFSIPNEDDPGLMCTTVIIGKDAPAELKAASRALAARAPMQITTTHADGSKVIEVVL